MAHRPAVASRTEVGVRLGDEGDARKGPDPEDRAPMDSDTHERDAPGRGGDHPIDLAALRADDALVEELAAGLVALGQLPRETRSTDDELVAMLAAWVAEVRPEDETQVATPAAASGHDNGDPDHPASVIPIPLAKQGHGKHRAAAPYARRIAIAAALILIGTSGLAVGSSEASPGEVLWPISKVFYADRARSLEAAADVNSGLEVARTAIRQGRPADAARAIAK